MGVGWGGAGSCCAWGVGWHSLADQEHACMTAAAEEGRMTMIGD